MSPLEVARSVLPIALEWVRAARRLLDAPGALEVASGRDRSVDAAATNALPTEAQCATSAEVERHWAALRANTPLDDGEARVLTAALRTNFAWAKLEPHNHAAVFEFVRGHFACIEQELTSASALRVARADDVRRFFGDAPPPAYVHEGLIWLTDEFRPHHRATGRGFGPKCLAAMLVHESVHVFDEHSGAPDLHISEWDEPRFSSIPPVMQRHNPSAYASFAAQAHARALEWPVGARFGAGRPAD